MRKIYPLLFTPRSESCLNAVGSGDQSFKTVMRERSAFLKVPKIFLRSVRQSGEFFKTDHRGKALQGMVISEKLLQHRAIHEIALGRTELEQVLTNRDQVLVALRKIVVEE